MEQKNCIIISPDIDVLYSDSEGYCYSPVGDEIYNEDLGLGPRFRFVIPGIAEWHKRYELATNFAETTTDSSFDWQTWHYEGLCFAKAIWKQMPRSFSLYYEPPYEDRSHTVGRIEMDEHIDIFINKLGKNASRKISVPSFTDNVDFKTRRGDNEVLLLFQLNRRQTEVSIPFNRLSGLRNWLKNIIAGNSSTSSLILQGFCLLFFRQTVGSHPEMGQFRIEKPRTHDNLFNAYVNIKNFIKGVYLSLMTELGFGFYENVDDCPSGDDSVRVWTPYNQLKSRSVESFITGLSPVVDGPRTFVNKTYVMFPDWGGCIFWDTMGIGSGNAENICLDDASDLDIKLNVPGLKKWSEFYDNHGDSQTFEEYWLEGWGLATLVRRQLPDNIDLFYMCYDPKQPNVVMDYNGNLPRIIVPKQ